MSASLPEENAAKERITICKRLRLRTREFQHAKLSDKVPAISIVLDIFDDSFASAAFALVFQRGGGWAKKRVVEAACGIAEGKDLELGDYVV